MIFTTTRELLSNHASVPFLSGEWPPSYAVDLVNVGISILLSVGHSDDLRCRTYDESMAKSSSHSEGFVLAEE